MTTQAEVANRRMERADIEMLLVLEKSPKKTLHWEDRIGTVPLARAPGTPRDAPVRMQQTLLQGLESQVNAFCDENPHLTVIPLKEEQTRFQDGHVEKWTPEPYRQRCNIARLEGLAGWAIEHVGQADEETAKQPTRLLRLTEEGQKMIESWKEGRLQGVLYPDARPPKAKKDDEGGDKTDPKDTGDADPKATGKKT